MEKKKYGLIIKSAKRAVGLSKAASIFGNESSEEDEEKAKKAVNEAINQEAVKKRQIKQTQVEVQKALEEDPSVYEYDEVYDELQKKKVDSKVIDKDKNAKYITNLMKSAAMRKREQERRLERKIQKEREAEGDEYEDKEAFVTSSYRKKMTEQAEEEERLRQQDALDAAMDVTKQKDMSNFYRHLLDQNVSVGGSFSTAAQNLTTDESAMSTSTDRKKNSDSDQTSKGETKARQSEKYSSKNGDGKSEKVHRSKEHREGKGSRRHSLNIDTDARRNQNEVRENVADDKVNKRREDKHRQKERALTESDSDSTKDKIKQIKEKQKSDNRDNKLERRMNQSDSESDYHEPSVVKDRAGKSKTNNTAKSNRDKAFESDSTNVEKQQVIRKKTCDDKYLDKAKHKRKSVEKSKSRPRAPSDSESEAGETGDKAQTREQHRSKGVGKHASEKHQRHRGHNSSQSDDEETAANYRKAAKRKHSMSASSEPEEDQLKISKKKRNKQGLYKHTDRSPSVKNKQYRMDKHHYRDERKHQNRQSSSSSSELDEKDLSKSKASRKRRHEGMQNTKVHQSSSENKRCRRRSDSEFDNDKSSRKNGDSVHDHKGHKAHKKIHRRKDQDSEEDPLVSEEFKSRKHNRNKRKFSDKKNRNLSDDESSKEELRTDYKIKAPHDKKYEVDTGRTAKMTVFSRRNDEKSLMSARNRYLARKKARQNSNINYKEDSD